MCMCVCVYIKKKSGSLAPKLAHLHAFLLSIFHKDGEVHVAG